MEIESRIGTIQADQSYVFYILSDFRNLNKFMPPEQVSDLVSDMDSCSFTIASIGKFGMRIVEREPYTKIKIGNTEFVPFSFTLVIHLTEVSEKITQIEIRLNADLNPIIKLVAQKPLTNFLETLVSKLETIKP
jgi:hypothetical protein